MSLSEKLLELCDYKIWLPTHNDPTIKGPPPRILSRRQWEAIEKMRKEKEYDGEDAVQNNDGV
jgi:hypothetical protein